MSHPLEEYLTILITEPLGALHVSTSQNILKTETHSVLTFTASLESGVGAEFVWNVSGSQPGSMAHIDNSVNQLNSTAEITFIRPDTYTINVRSHVSLLTFSVMLYSEAYHCGERSPSLRTQLILTGIVCSQKCYICSCHIIKFLENNNHTYADKRY